MGQLLFIVQVTGRNKDGNSARQHPEFCRRPRDELTVRSHRFRFACDDLDFPSLREVHRMPFAETPGAERGSEPEHVPKAQRFDAVQGKPMIVDTGFFRDRHAASVVAPIADRYLNRVNAIPLAIAHNIGVKRAI
jgi:hypothetical protein